MNLRIKVIVQENKEQYDQFGVSIAKNWQDKFVISCSIERLSSSEIFLWSRQKISATNKITTRYNTNISPRDRFLYKNRIFEIIGIEHDEMNKIYSYFIVRELIDA